MSQTVLVVEDDKPVRDALCQTLELAELVAMPASAFVVAKDRIARDFPGVIVSDIRMPGRDGLHLLDYAQSVDPDLPVILLTGEGDIPTAVGAMNKGAFDFLEKPCPTEALVGSVRRALHARELVLENRRLKAQLTQGDAAARLIFGVSDRAGQLREELRQVARVGGPVLVQGAPGSGVPKVAEVVHLLSDRAARAFVKRAAADLRAGALAKALEAALGGSLFLDEISTLPMDTQFALAEALDGGADVRVIAGATHDILALCADGRFNSDLYYRLEALRVRIPALRERPEDIPVLFRHYVAHASEQAGIPAREIAPPDLARLMTQDWPGNARALMNAAMRFALGLELTDAEDEIGLAEKMAQIERSLLTDALRRNHGNASATAEQLKLPRKTLYDKFTRFGIRAEDYR